MSKNSKIAILILIILLEGAFLVCYSYLSLQSKSPPLKSTSSLTPPAILTDQGRQDIMNKPYNVPLRNPNVTDADRAKIMNKPLKK